MSKETKKEEIEELLDPGINFSDTRIDLSEHELEIASREYCEIFGADPDIRLDDYPGCSGLKPQWQITAHDIVKVEAILHCLEVARIGRKKSLMSRIFGKKS